MNQQEWTALSKTTPTPEQWEVINEVYTFHPAIPDVGGKKVLADLYKVGGFGLIASMLLAARTSQGYDGLVSLAGIELEKLATEKKAVLAEFARREAELLQHKFNAQNANFVLSQSFKAETA